MEDLSKKNSRKKRGILKAFFSSAILCCCLAMPVYAADQITTNINNIKELVINIIAAVGGIVLAFGIFEFASAYQSHDSSQMTQSLKKVVSGILMVAVRVVLALVS